MSKGSVIISDFLIFQGCVATQLRFSGRRCNNDTEFLWESASERILKIGLHLPKL